MPWPGAVQQWYFQNRKLIHLRKIRPICYDTRGNTRTAIGWFFTP